MSKLAFRPAAIECFLFRCPAEPPLATAFGVMRDRPALLVRLTDAEGAQGWGEIFANWPPGGPEHRRGLVGEVLAGLALGRDFASPEALFAHLTAANRTLALQCDEPGPFAQAICGLDIAAWDLVARRAGEPLWRLLGSADSPAALPAYASGIGPEAPERVAERKWREGYRAFKLKIGFGHDRDAANLAAMRAALPPAVLMVDANQAFDRAQALAAAAGLAPSGPVWFEEPIAADAPDAEWLALARDCPLPLAGGENLRGEDAFRRAAGWLAYLQPDVIKWGGLSLGRRIAAGIAAAGRRYCPHYLGGGIGLVASAHLMAAMGGAWLEVDANDNPLRQDLAQPFPPLVDGALVLSGAPGLGVAPDLAALARWRR
ncbi:MAG: mandelate racemase/muconate lactonizing enzyme family protein [Thalassobaculales bacterium]